MTWKNGLLWNGVIWGGKDRGWLGDDLRWWWTVVLKTWREEWACKEGIHRWEKRGMKMWRWAVILDFLEFHLKGVAGGPRVHCRNLGEGEKAWKEQRVQDQKGGIWKKGMPPTVLRCESGWSIDSPSLQEVQICLKSLVSSSSRWERCEGGVPAQRREQYSIMLPMKALLLDNRSGGLRKNFAHWRMPILALKVNWLSRPNQKCGFPWNIMADSETQKF